MANLELRFGAFAKPIAEQLNEQSFNNVPKDKIEHWQKDADAIVRLVIEDLLPDSQARKSRQKLLNNIARYIREQK